MSKTRTWTLLALIVGLMAAFVAAGCGDDDEGDTGGDSTTASGDETAALPLIEEGTHRPGDPAVIERAFHAADPGVAQRFVDRDAAVAHAQPGVAVALDGAVVPRALWDRTIVPDGGVVEVLTAVQGG